MQTNACILFSLGAGHFCFEPGKGRLALALMTASIEGLLVSAIRT